MLTRLKQKAQQLLTTEARAAHKIGLTPNMISLIGVSLAFLAALTYLTWQNRPIYLLGAAVLLILSGFCDALDGIVARLFEKATVFGGFMDSLLDRYADAVVYGGVILGGLCNILWGIVAIVGSLLVSYSRARAEAAGIMMESVGLAERAERIIILAVASLVAIFWQPATTVGIAIILLAVLSHLTVLQRSIRVYNKSKERAR